MLGFKLMHNLNRNSDSFPPYSASQASNAVLVKSARALNSKLAATELCRVCSNLISGEYYRINGKKVCPCCAVQARTGLSAEGDAAFAGSLMFGFGGAILGLIFCAGFTISTHLSAGYASIVAAWIVSSSMKRGSNGLGGGRFQVTAVLLTCVTVWLATVSAKLFDTYSTAGSVAEWVAAIWHRPVWEHVALFFGAGSDLLHLVIRIGCLCAGFCLAWQTMRSKPLSVAGPYGLMAP